MGSPPLPSPTPSLVTQRIPFILPLLASGAAIDIVAQPGERGIASGLPATRLPEPVLHRPPLNQLQLLQPPQPLRPSGIQSGPLWTLSPSHPSMRRGRRKRIPLHPTSNLGTHLGGGRTTLTGVWKKPTESWTNKGGLENVTSVIFPVNRTSTFALGTIFHSLTINKKSTLKLRSGLPSLCLPKCSHRSLDISLW